MLAAGLCVDLQKEFTRNAVMVIIAKMHDRHGTAAADGFRAEKGMGVDVLQRRGPTGQHHHRVLFVE